MATKSDLPRFDEYFAPTVQSLKKRGGSATIEEHEDDVAELMKLSDGFLQYPQRTGDVRNSNMTSLGYAHA
jgi:hypothetical protein